MNVSEAIRTRRNVKQFRPDPIARPVLQGLLDTAVWAPVHKLTEPWTFYVVEGETRERLAQRRAELRREKFPDPDSEQARDSARNAYQMMKDAPAVVMITTHLSEDDPIRSREDYAATACAAHNLTLAAWEAGIASGWSTGPFVDDPQVRETLGLAPEESIVTVLFMGYPAALPQGKRTPATAKTRWLS